MSWSDTPIHFIDFEGSHASGIVEFGVVTLQRSEVVATRTRLCQPSGEIRALDTEVHGLTAAATQSEAPFSEEFGYFASLREQGPFAAHYAAVENSLLKAVWAYPRLSPDFARPGERIAEWGPWLDTGRLCAELYPGGSRQLEQLVGAWALSGELDELAAWHCPASRRRFHAALYDALAGAVLLRALLRVPTLAQASLPWLLQMSVADPAKRSGLQQGELF